MKEFVKEPAVIFLFIIFVILGAMVYIAIYHSPEARIADALEEANKIKTKELNIKNN